MYCCLSRGEQSDQAASEPKRSFGRQWGTWIGNSE